MKVSTLLLVVMMVTLIKESHEVEVLPEVTGNVGDDVTLPCQLAVTAEQTNVTQVQWDLTQPERQKIPIALLSYQFGTHISDSPLKDRAELVKDSLKIKDVVKEDSGTYTCTITTFPQGPFEGNINLDVREPKRVSPGIISAIVAAVVLFLLTVTAIAYISFVKRCNSPARHHVFIDTAAPAADLLQPSVTGGEGVVYAEVKVKICGDRSPINPIQREAVHADDVTYSEVFFAASPVK